MQRSDINPMITRLNFFRGVGLLSATAALSACGQAQSTSTEPAGPLVAIIHTNDTHGHDVAVEGTEDVQGNFSMAAVPALKAEWEKKGYEVLLVDAGDATQGTPLVDVDKGSTAITFMNACGYQMMTVGNHDFDWGRDSLETNRKNAQFPFLSANVLLAETGEPLFECNKIVELADGTKVGFFGLTTPSTLTTTNPKNVADLKFLKGDELYACVQAQVDELRDQGCELVVCLSHLGNEALGTGQTSKDVLQNVKGIDLCIDGHDHEEVQDEVEGIPLVETGCYLHNIGVIAIDEGLPATELVAAGTYDGIDTSVQAIIDTEDERIESQLGVEVGETAFLLDGEREPGLRTQETNLGDFCTDAFRWTAANELGQEVDASVLNGGGMRVSIDEGPISLKIIKTVFPFSNQVAVLNVTGAQLLEALEAACQGVGEGIALGAFPQVSGITFQIDATVPYEEGPLYPNSTYASPANPGARVTISDVGGKGFAEDAVYSIATITYLCDGGDTYYAFKEAADIEQPVTFGFDYEAVTSYLITECDHVVPEEYAEPQGRITIIGE